MNLPSCFGSSALAAATAMVVSLLGVNPSANSAVVRIDRDDGPVWEGDRPGLDSRRLAFATQDEYDSREAQTRQAVDESPSISIPEASTWAMILIWAAGLGLVRSRKSRRSISID